MTRGLGLQQYRGPWKKPVPRPDAPRWVGRDAELHDIALHLKTKPIVQITGPTGIGKSALGRRFLWGLGHAGPLFVWSFAGGAGVEALVRTFFGFTQSPGECSVSRVIDLLREKCFLLVLDGVETLPGGGWIRDQDVRELVLAAEPDGYRCLVTAGTKLTELGEAWAKLDDESGWEGHAGRVDVGPLPHAEAVMLLRRDLERRSVRGNALIRCGDAAEEAECHPLGVLVASAILELDPAAPLRRLGGGDPVAEVISCYAEVLREHDRGALRGLCLASVFEGAIDQGGWERVTRETDREGGGSDASVVSFQELGRFWPLVEEAPHGPGPAFLMSPRARDVLRKVWPEDLGIDQRHANYVLSRVRASSVGEIREREAVRSMVDAVVYACRAERYDETFTELVPRLVKDEYAVTRKLGAHADLQRAVEAMLDDGPSGAKPLLWAGHRARLRFWAGYNLAALNDPGARRLLDDALSDARIDGDPDLVAEIEWQVGETRLRAGELIAARDFATRAATGAAPDNARVRVQAWALVGACYHMMDEASAAEEAFAKSFEARSTEFGVDSVAGYRFVDYLLGLRTQPALERARAALEGLDPTRLSSLRAKGLYSLAAARISWRLPDRRGEGEVPFQEALRPLRAGGHVEDLALYYLLFSSVEKARAREARAPFTKAWKALHRARMVAKQGRLRLREADVLVMTARIYAAEGREEDRERAKRDARRACKLLGYRHGEALVDRIS